MNTITPQQLASSKASCAAYYQANKEIIAAYNKAWREENPDKVAAHNAKHYKTNKAAVLAQQKLYRAENAAMISANKKIYNEKNKEDRALKRKAIEATPEGKEKKRLAGIAYRAKKKAQLKSSNTDTADVF